MQKPELEEFGGDLASIIGALVAPLWVTRALDWSLLGLRAREIFQD